MGKRSEDRKEWGEFKRKMLQVDKKRRSQRELQKVLDEQNRRNKLLPLIENDEDFE